MNKKIIPQSKLGDLIKKLRGQNKKIVTCNGCFDILHVGHIKFLREAKQQGDVLIVGLNSDKSVKMSKGPKRPINNQDDRAEVVSALEIVDYVTVFDEKDPRKLLSIIKPDVHCNGEEYGKGCIEGDIVKRYGGKIYLIKLVKGFSTTKIIEKTKKWK
ncbi:adenylyltransferase/cytidyltransferase family protein [Candidatus Woesearchaeota archaeon]|nr:adenylyltransferase/cytidyltransferase family protein [Candidatus Woesearchaeota archaeon]